MGRTEALQVMYVSQGISEKMLQIYDFYGLFLLTWFLKAGVEGKALLQHFVSSKKIRVCSINFRTVQELKYIEAELPCRSHGKRYTQTTHGIQLARQAICLF